MILTTYIISSGVDDALYDGDYSGLKDLAAVDSALMHTYVKIRRLLSVVSSLNSHRNSLPPISSLPPEVLAEIFQYCTHRNHTAWEYDKSWPVFSQVCGHWRQIALSTPSLWTDVDLRLPMLTRMMIQRAQSSPLDVSAPTCSNLVPMLDDYRTVKAISAGTWDYTDENSNNQADTESQLNSYFSGEFLHLQQINLRVHFGAVLLLNLENFRATYLRDLSLCNVWSNSVWARETVTNLTALRVTLLKWDPRRRFEGLLECLRATTMLESLDIRIEGAISPPSFTTTEPVVLPQLRYLHFADYSVLRPLLDVLEIPNFISISLSAREEREPSLAMHYASVRRLMDMAGWVPTDGVVWSPGPAGYYSLEIHTSETCL